MPELTPPSKATPDHKPFFITFGRTGIRNGYVTVWAYSEDIARAWAHREYDRCWSGIYDGWAEGMEAFPAGELAVEVLFYEDARHI